ncbi:C_GCAxxG_C_C family probable redox protein [Clostridium tetanomorphum]|uniref:Oxidoreductase n=1 Tax=Clostridium tetanomorphum TaxID=1553 RepID=A0A923J0V2_CLOTT|nr:C-GCAxxG-C-C family (seleno)protein [Clostridium tetanomorphum]KAJ51657.1 C GCAxxG C C family protein subfamily [Clostridium tetanomorphum DSM 665]KAJ51937.1 C GCAxxG C C family protein subfamily [Clostridium tetanomorphum DSM 665]MBC2398666.1 oxidoreductase [Clostridium tetanomorphum]MBP1864054.1 C_GCAxxG_C_C family probable redox protein [Clostridium tetanomorphum]NRS84467.1 C_GCAxxG_C_C family probable redox protein [Clostridium tetanomorphum]
MINVLKYHDKGYNCAESIVKAFNEEYNANIPVSIASPFGTGMAVGTTCGAITGAIIALGSVKGREEVTVKNESRKYTKEIMNKIKEKYGTFECLELKKKGISCSEIIEYVYDILKEYIK